MHPESEDDEAGPDDERDELGLKARPLLCKQARLLCPRHAIASLELLGENGGMDAAWAVFFQVHAGGDEDDDEAEDTEAEIAHEADGPVEHPDASGSEEWERDVVPFGEPHEPSCGAPERRSSRRSHRGRQGRLIDSLGGRRCLFLQMPLNDKILISLIY